MQHIGLSRRKMLAALASAGAATRLAPFIPAAVRAADAPKRLLVVFSPMGYLENSFWPKGTTTDFTLGETMAALNDYKSKLLYVDNLMLYGAQWFFPDDDNEHGSGGAMAFTGAKKDGYSAGPSVDQAVADHVYAQTKTKFRHLALGVNAPSPSPHTAVFFSKAQTPVNAQNDPSAAFDMMFKDFKPPGSAPVDTTALDRLRRQKQSVIDLVKGDIDRICANAGTEDRRKCEAHLAGIQMLESRLPKAGTAPTPTTTCTTPTKSPGGSLVNNIHAQMDVITAAFACDLTRVASLQLGNCDGGLDMISGLNHHDTTHAVGDSKGAAGPIDNHKRIDKWFADRWAYLLRKMESVKEGNGTLLDNTLIVFGSDTTTGQSMELGAHQHWRMPLWMAGGGNFAFRTGRYISLPRPDRMGSPAQSAMWTVHNRLLVSVCKAFGMATDKFGSMDPGSGGITQLT